MYWNGGAAIDAGTAITHLGKLGPPIVMKSRDESKSAMIRSPPQSGVMDEVIASLSDAVGGQKDVKITSRGNTSDRRGEIDEHTEGKPTASCKHTHRSKVCKVDRQDVM